MNKRSGKFVTLEFALFILLFFAGFVKADWPMAGANPQRTSAVSDEVRGNIGKVWFRPIEPFINYKIQVIAATVGANKRLFISTARGLYCLDADNGAVMWVHATQVPLGHSPTYYNGKVYVGSYDRTIHCVDANTGLTVSGWNPAVALAGFETNPLVVDAGQGVRVYAGNRDSYFYCLDATTGALIWKYKSGGFIRFSAAMDSTNVLYFAAADLYAYAIKDNGITYQEMWKSSKMIGEGFSTYWPVVYKNWVIFSGITGQMYGFSNTMCLVIRDKEIGSMPGPTGTEPGNWTTGTETADAGAICQYYEAKPYRRRVFILNRSDGKEYTYDSDNDGIPEYAPFTWSAATNGGSKYPPVVGNDGVLYTEIDYYINPSAWIPTTGICGWTEGTKYISHVGGEKGEASAADEPMAYSIGGKVAHYVLCCDRCSGSFDVTIPYGQPNRSWGYWNYQPQNVFGDYMTLYHNPLNQPGSGTFGPDKDWSVYGDAGNGIYARHGTAQNPWIPYSGKLYKEMGNGVVAMAPGGTATGILPMEPIQPVVDSIPSVTVAQLKQLLEEEIQKMVSAGHLKPALNVDLCQAWDRELDMDNGFDTFCNPGETIYTLVKALPHLSAALQAQTSAYIKSEMALDPIDTIAHIGFIDGVWRQGQQPCYDEISQFLAYGKQTSVHNHEGQFGNYPWTWPMMSYYAAWKYVLVWPSEASRLYTSMKTKLTVPCAVSDTKLPGSQQVLNAYLAGYMGFLELQKLAGMDVTDAALRTQVTNEYNRLLTLRVNNISFDTPHTVAYTGNVDYGQGFATARHFLYLVPEVAQDLKSRLTTSAIQAVLDKINYVTPYWFVSNYDASIFEMTSANFYNVMAFNGRAMLLQEPYEELLKYLDAPGAGTGDLFFIQNLVNTIESAPLTAVKLNVTANPTLMQADGVNTSAVQARVCDAADRTMANSNATITFTLSGSAGGSLVGTNPVAATGGIATITYTAGTSAGTATITATSAGLTQGSVNITLIANTPPAAPTNLLCSGQSNPSSVSDFTPDLSWTFNDPNSGSGDTQSAYRLLVANSQSALDSNNGNMWDTRHSGQANTVTYAGTTLLPNTQYFWKVMTWDSFNSTGTYSSVGAFTMANALPQQNPLISISSTSLNFGEVEMGRGSPAQALTITNSGGGALTGTISTSDAWIKIDKTSLNLAAQAEEQVTVSVDNSLLAQKEGPAKGEITITSNGNNGSQVTTTISVEFTATCVLVKPSPVKAGQPITFFGDGIVSGQTKIIIYTLSGTVVADLSAPDNATAPINGQLQNEITWQPTNLSPGIYVFTYESPKEKGVSKFTVVP